MAEIGIILRNARVQRGLTIEQAAQDTRISPRFLEALEAEQFDALPAPVYVRGFLRSYANYLRLDAGPLLAQFEGGGPPVAGPDSFVGGPRRTQQEAPAGRTDPFRAPRRPSATPPPPPPPPPLIADSEAEESWEPEPPADFAGEAGEPYSDGGAAEEQDYPPEEPVFRSRRVAGVLVEREPLERDSGRTVRILVMAGGGAIVVLVIAIAVMLLGGGSGNKSNLPAAASETPTRASGTIIPVGTPTAKASVSPSPAASVSPSPTGSVSPSPTGTPATPTPPPPTPKPGQPTPTPTETPTPTPTVEPPTPIPPTPKPTPTPLPPSGYAECGPSLDGTLPYDCSPWPYRVICYPNGWFVDRYRDYTYPIGAPGWAEKTVPGPSFAGIADASVSHCQ